MPQLLQMTVDGVNAIDREIFAHKNIHLLNFHFVFIFVASVHRRCGFIVQRSYYSMLKKIRIFNFRCRRVLTKI